MPRKKVNLQWIANNSTRKSTFNKRRNALIKKVSELRAFCGVKVSLVVYGDEVDKTKPPVVYPSVPEARQLLSSFKAMPDHLENWKKVTNMEEYLRGRISKLQDQKRKNAREKQEETTLHNLHKAMDGNRSAVLAGLKPEELIKLDWLVQSKIMSVKEHFQQFGIEPVSFQEPLLPPPLEQQPTLSTHEMQNLASVEESQPQQHDLLAALAWNEEIGSVVYSDLGVSNNGGAGPSNSSGGTMDHYNMEGLGLPWSRDPFPNME